jgi:very-short-patch-repair endonuclease
VTLHDLAREIRQSPTRSEDRLWSWLRDRRFSGCKFRRQHPIAGYILDFYCPELKLAIEVDGWHHSQITYEEDYVRTMELKREGIEVVRIANELFVRDYLAVIDIIQEAIRERAK